LVCLIISSMMGLTVLADDFDWSRFPCVTPDSVLLPPGQAKSDVWYYPKQRGDYIAGANLSISDEGNGTIGIFAQTLTHYPIDKCRMRVYLDRWYENKNAWENLDYWDITFLKENEESGVLTMPTIYFHAYDLPTGYYYRLRGLHAIWVNGTTEGFSTQTDGIKLIK